MQAGVHLLKEVTIELERKECTHSPQHMLMGKTVIHPDPGDQGHRSISSGPTSPATEFCT